METMLDYFKSGTIEPDDMRLIQAKAIEALVYYKSMIPSLRGTPLKVEIKDDRAYLILPNGNSIPFMKLKKRKSKGEYEIWLLTDLSLNYVLNFLERS